MGGWEMRKPLFTLILAFTVMSRVAGASVLIEDNFVRIGSEELVIAPFTAVSGAPTADTYSGSVEVIVSGTGFSFGLNVNDAFYCAESADFRCPAPGVVLPQYYQLNIGLGGLPFAGGEANCSFLFLVV